MKIFAMIGGKQVGPMMLDDIVDAGVRPDTYVWCKGMPDWQKASEVPDICRYFRLRLAGVLPDMRPAPGGDSRDMMLAQQAEQEALLRQLPPMAQNLVRKSGVKLRKENLPDPSRNHESRWLPVIVYTICTILILIGFFLLRL